MDQVKLEQKIQENMKAIFGFSLTRLGNVKEAEELASDILYQIVRSANNLKDEERFYGFLWKVAENTYKDYLRKKAKNASRITAFDENTADESDSPLDDLIKNEELNRLRRELSLLSKQYRDAAVLYYIEHLSCSEVANQLHISVEMVKYYLFRARKIIREGMNLERLYGEKSYRPCQFEIDFWGTKAGDDREYRDFQARKIKGNILLAAYYSPATLQEISIELGVALPYLEDEVGLLVNRQYLIRKNETYRTNIPIFTLDCTKAIDGRLKEEVGKTAAKIMAVSDNFNARFGNRFSDENLARWQKMLLCLHYSLADTAHDLEKTYGALPADGPYSLVNGGGGRGILWGRCSEKAVGETLLQGIQGIYNGCPSKELDGNVIAMNFSQMLNAQHFTGTLTEPVIRSAIGQFSDLSKEWQDKMEQLGYTIDGKTNVAVWTKAEYGELRTLLSPTVAAVSELNRKTMAIASAITADLAPSHIRTSAEYAGATVYRFHAIDRLIGTLFDRGWLKTVDVKDKPAVCVVRE